MYKRKLFNNLQTWKLKENRKPLILRGARQVGKTTLIKMFASEFDFFIPLNLDLQNDAKLFDQTDDVSILLQLLYLRFGIAPSPKDKVLLFIDEIQSSEKAIRLLRYFYELLPDIYVIAAGSLLESLLSNTISFPVGRVEYMLLRPFSFEEYLWAKGNQAAINAYQSDQFPVYAHYTLSELFSEYALIGGMPEIVNEYLKHGKLSTINSIYDSLIVTYSEDVEKYANNERHVQIIRHIIGNAFVFAGERITFEGFANSNYKSKDIGDCFRILEKTFLISLIYPTTQISIPIIENTNKAPKLHVLDTGLINRFAGVQAELLANQLSDAIYEGKIAEHITGQELLTLHESVLYKNNFWVKEKKQSNAEIDYLLSFNGLLLPIEVKAGKTGRLRSLMEYMDLVKHEFAIRVYSGELSIDKIQTLAGKQFYLLNLPFYLIGQIHNYAKLLVENQQLSD
ncbi:MAG TPA: AAA family ATPase [Bacteroidales bacterium]|nr:AAA family ATPase [Bacteroidales bacterium]